MVGTMSIYLRNERKLWESRVHGFGERFPNRSIDGSTMAHKSYMGVIHPVTVTHP